MSLSITGPGGLLMCYVRCTDDQINPHIPKPMWLTCHHMESPSLSPSFSLPLSVSPSMPFPPADMIVSLNGTTGSSSSASTRMGGHLGCCNALEQIRLALLPGGGLLRNM